jgi:hypothetical protein
MASPKLGNSRLNKSQVKAEETILTKSEAPNKKSMISVRGKIASI